MNWKIFNPPSEVERIFAACKNLTVVNSTNELIDLSCGGSGKSHFEVSYDVPGFGKVVEAEVSRVRNGVSVNFTTAYMRRRDPDALVVGDDFPTDKQTFKERFGYDFSSLKKKTLDWLVKQPLIVYGFVAGKKGTGVDAICIAPANSGFFAFCLALLQGIIPYEEIPGDFQPECVIYVAPTFRYTDLGGKQVVVHNRLENLHEVFSYNLYPGPSAKKAIYGVLIELGERQGWVTAHCSTVSVQTPYDNITTIMHEGASGAGKSEMLELAHREEDGRLLLGQNIITGERRHMEIPRTCDLYPVNDDMALCHPSLKTGNGKLTIMDAEDAWFVRTNHIESYGTDVHLEKLTAQSPEPLMFLNINAVPGSRALIWEHIEDEPGKRCTNPRVTIPRRIIPGIVDGPVDVDIRSFGVRCPPCTRENPTYGIIGLFHILPPALAWIWRLVSPRGYDNPSITPTEGFVSEGVGSYWPFAAGKRVRQANLLLDQFIENPHTHNILIPNQYIGAWKVGFMPQWIAREYLARHGNAKFKPEQLRHSRCSLLGSTLFQMQVEGRLLFRWFLMVDTQPEVGEEAYDIGAKTLYNFFRECLQEYLTPEISLLGKQIIDCCFDNGNIEDYEKIIPLYR